MSMGNMQAVVARLLTDREYRKRFFEKSIDGRDCGLEPEEVEIIQRINPDSLDAISEGYVGKRMERVESCFPITVRALESIEVGILKDYLHKTRFPSDESSERRTFLDYLSEVESLPIDVCRYLQDLATLESELYQIPLDPGPPTYRIHSQIRPLQNNWVRVFRSKGNIKESLTQIGNRNIEYPSQPVDWLVCRRGQDVGIEELTNEKKGLWMECNGENTMHMLEDRHGDWIKPVLNKWFRDHIVVEGDEGGMVIRSCLVSQ